MSTKPTLSQAFDSRWNGFWSLPNARRNSINDLSVSMNNKKTKAVANKSNLAAQQYKLRTECRTDCVYIRAVLLPWLQMWSEKSGWEPWSEESQEPEGNSWNWSADTDVEFTLVAGAPQLSEIRWLINSIADCHVAAETVEVSERYTGERLYDRLDSQLETPTKEVIMVAKGVVSRAAELHELNRETMQDTARCLQEQLRNMELKATPKISVADFNHRMWEKRLAEKIQGIERRARKKIEQLRCGLSG